MVGRVEPIPLPDKMDSLGLGKANIETRMLDDAVAKRPKVLESQRIANETEEQRTAREVLRVPFYYFMSVTLTKNMV